MERKGRHGGEEFGEMEDALNWDGGKVIVVKEVIVVSRE